MSALKIEVIEEKYHNQVKEIEEVLRGIASELDFSEDRTGELECRRRDGFIPHSWNHGGINAYGYNDLSGVIGSGIMTGSDKANKVIREDYDTQVKECIEQFCTDKGISQVECYSDFEDELREEYYDYEHDYLSVEYNSISVEYQGRYLGCSYGLHTISLNVFISVLDAPYHRGSDDDIEVEITFRDIKSKSVQKKIELAVETLSDFKGSIELW